MFITSPEGAYICLSNDVWKELTRLIYVRKNDFKTYFSLLIFDPRFLA